MYGARLKQAARAYCSPPLLPRAPRTSASVLLDFQVFALHIRSFQCVYLTRPFVNRYIITRYVYIAPPCLDQFCLLSHYLLGLPLPRIYLDFGDLL
jgi:hypothetical protein